MLKHNFTESVETTKVSFRNKRITIFVGQYYCLFHGVNFYLAEVLKQIWGKLLMGVSDER